MEKQLKAQAEKFLSLHHQGKLLILPNIWDVIGAKLLEELGYKAVATASMSVAFSRGYDDGEHIEFDELLRIIQKISSAIELPLTVDIEKGYASSSKQLQQNIRNIVKAGAVGINIEDSKDDDSGLHPIEDHCKKINLIRKTADELDIHLVINARSDIYVTPQIQPEKRLEESIQRANAYQEAGADCFYPMLLDDTEAITALIDNVDIPINLFLNKQLTDLRHLEKLGVARVSLGPLYLMKSLAAMKKQAEQLMSYEAETLFDAPMISSDFVRKSLLKL